METELSVHDSFSLSHFWRGAIDLFRAPKTLLRSMSKDGGYGKPIVYALLWQYVASLLALIVSFIRPLPTPWGTVGKILALLFMPPLTVLVGLVFAGVFFVIWHLMGSSHNYQTAFRIWALFAPLAVASAVLRLIPYVSLVVTVFYFYLLVAASVEVHGIRPTKAWTVWSLLLAVFALLVVVAGVLGAARGRLLSSPRGPAMPGFPTAPAFPLGAPSSSQTMSPAELQKKMEADMAASKAEFERVRKESQALPPPQKPLEKKAPAKK